MEKEMSFIKKTMAIGLLTLMVFWGLSAAAVKPAQAQGETIRVGYMDYGGFIEKATDATFTGYGADYLHKISEYTGYQYDYVYGTWPELLTKLQNHEIDFLCTAQYTDERAAIYDYSAYPIGYTQGLLYGKKDSPMAYGDYAAFNGMTVGTLKGNAMTAIFAQYASRNGFSYTLVEYDTKAEMLAALDGGEVDAICDESLSSETQLTLLSQFGADAYYLMSYKDSPYMRDVNYALQEIKTDVDFETDLYHKYYDSSTAATTIQFTQAELGYLAQAGEIKVGLNTARPPFSEYDAATDTFMGINVDVLEEIAKTTGLTFKYVPMEVGKTSTELLDSGNYDVLCGIERDNFATSDTMVATAAFLSSSIVPVGRPGEVIDLNQNLTVTFPTSFQALQKYITRVYPNLTIKTYPSNRECLDAVMDGEADVFIQNTHILSRLLQEPQYETLEILPVEIMTEHTAMAMVKADNTLLLSVLNKAINGMDDAVVSSSLIKHTFASPYQLTFWDFIYKFRRQITLILVVVIGAMVLIYMSRRRNEKKLKEKNHQLGEAVIQAEEANASKSQFLARMSHEIRTPMNAIVGMTTLARSKVDQPEQTLDYLNKIEGASKVLLNIINDVLDMSAIESDKMHLANNPFNFKELINGITALYYGQCKTKEITFNVTLRDVTSEVLVGDSLRLNQILLNLLSNALKFTPRGGTIHLDIAELSVKENQGYFELTVADSGCGMDDAMLHRLFKPFEQESATTAKEYGGSGLGLSITKNLVDMMHGTIRATSQKGEGTTFTVNLPFGIGESPTLESSDKFKSIRALVVDDDEDTRDYTAIVLDRIGIEHHSAPSGEEAVKMLEDAHAQGSGYDVCFLDWKMPGMDGITLTRHIRELYDEDTIIIIVSAYDLSEVAEEAKAAGANIFVTKPLFQSTVFDVLMGLSGGKYKTISTEADTYNFTGKRVLLAEDNALNMEIATELLAMTGLKVDGVENGLEALKAFESSEVNTYDAILMDIQMPEMDGYEATTAIRKSAHPQGATIPILAMTANAFTEDVNMALGAGMNGHIAKPIDTEILYSTLSQCFKQKEN